jgi:hypothetical protein
VTDEPLDRRRQDSKLDAILEAQIAHVDEYHAFNKKELLLMVKQHEDNVASVAILTKGMDEGSKDISRLLVVVEGVPDYNANGQIIGYIGGMRNDISELKFQGNGGGGFSLRAKDKAQLTAFFTGIVLITNVLREFV